MTALSLRPHASPAVFAVRGRPTGRGRPRGPLLHAVPGTDKTRSALCGERVGGAPTLWPGAAATPPAPPVAGADVEDHVPGPCPECAALLPPLV